MRIEWRGECDFGPEDLLAPRQANGGRLAEAMVFLTELLTNGPVPQQVVKVKAFKPDWRTAPLSGPKRSSGSLQSDRGGGRGVRALGAAA